MPAGRAISALKGRDLRALAAFRDRLRASLGKALVRAVYLGRRALDVPPEVAAPQVQRRPGAMLAVVPVPEPPGELRLAVEVERRDLYLEDRVDAAALEVALELGALVLPVVVGSEDLAGPLGRASRVAAEIAAGDVLP